MRIRYILLLIFNFQFLIFNSVAQVGEWTWMQGSDTITNAQGVFGIQGVPDPANSPRFSHV